MLSIRISIRNVNVRLVSLCRGGMILFVIVSAAISAVNSSSTPDQLIESLSNELVNIEHVDPSVTPLYLTLLNAAKEVDTPLPSSCDYHVTNREQVT